MLRRAPPRRGRSAPSAMLRGRRADAPTSYPGGPMALTAPTREPIPPEPGTPRLLRLGDLLADLRADVEAAHLARVTGQARGPVTGLPPLDQELGGHLAPGVHIPHGGP